MKAYVLYSHRKKKRRMSFIGESNNSIAGNLEHPEEALLDFMPDKNECDAKLYEGIVEAPIIRKLMRVSADLTAGEDEMLNDEILNNMPARNNRYDDIETITSSDYSDGSDSSGDDSDMDGYTTGGRRGFQTNVDDFLQRFGSVQRVASSELNLRSKSSSTGR